MEKTYRDVRGKERNFDDKGWPEGSDKWADKGGSNKRGFSDLSSDEHFRKAEWHGKRSGKGNPVAKMERAAKHFYHGHLKDTMNSSKDDYDNEAYHDAFAFR